MKDYNREINYESFNNFVEYAFENGYEVKVVEGVLNDTFIIYNHDKKLSIKGVKGRDYIILYPKFLNSWSNSFHILLSDNENRLEEFLTETE